MAYCIYRETVASDNRAILPDRRNRPLLDRILDDVAHRYCFEPLRPEDSANNNQTAVRLVLSIESVRATMAAGSMPAETTRFEFLAALSELIREALAGSPPDPVFQALVLRHQSPQVREYAALSAPNEHNKRVLRNVVNAMAHPARQQRASSAELAAMLGKLHDASTRLQWDRLADLARRLLSWLEARHDIQGEHLRLLHQNIRRLLDEPALAELRRVTELDSDPLVQRYQVLLEQSGPRSGSPDASHLGAESKKRGAQTETLAAKALQALADRLSRESTRPQAQYRVVTSMRVPSALLADTRRGKGEWDAVLLYSSDASQGDEAVWDVCLLVEAKASADAATKDFPRLLKGLEILAEASSGSVYAFSTREGSIRISGASLCALSAHEASLKKFVMYCCDEITEGTPRLLSAASRMQLLSAPVSLDFASMLSDRLLAGKLKAGIEPPSVHQADLELLEPVWNELLSSPNWRPVLYQYQTLLQVRELMVHPDDLIRAVHDS